MSVRENIARAIVEGLRESDPGAYIEEDELIGGRLRGKIDGEFILPIDRILDALREPTEEMRVDGGEWLEDRIPRRLWPEDAAQRDVALGVYLTFIDAAKEG